MDDITEPRRHFPGRTRRLPARYDRDLYSWAVEQAAFENFQRVNNAEVVIDAARGRIRSELRRRA